MAAGVWLDDAVFVSGFGFWFGRICPVLTLQSLSVLCSGLTQSFSLCSFPSVKD